MKGARQYGFADAQWKREQRAHFLFWFSNNNL